MLTEDSCPSTNRSHSLEDCSKILIDIPRRTSNSHSDYSRSSVSYTDRCPVKRQRAVYVEEYSDFVPSYQIHMNSPLTSARRVRSAVDIAALFVYGKLSEEEERKRLSELLSEHKQQSLDAALARETQSLNIYTHDQ